MRTSCKENKTNIFCLDLFSQINELNKRMSAIESLLSRLEEKMTPADEVRQDANSKNWSCR